MDFTTTYPAGYDPNDPNPFQNPGGEPQPALEEQPIPDPEEEEDEDE
ncbi:MAG: hypothetical protein KGI06_06160 [Candidatus Micrarchaeota archaeon]|nr:hypothetical protein [Candidatus Micrarchaeota archaeon]